MAIWTPRLDGRTGPLYRRLLDALAEDIDSGGLPPQTRLPPHRELAYALGISPNTTSRAYAEGVARGLLRGEVGRGTFVREPGAPPPQAGPADMRRPAAGPVDLSRNLPHPGAAGRDLAQALAALEKAPHLPALLALQRAEDVERQTAIGINWLARSGITATREEVVPTVGAQHGLMATLLAVTRPGDLILTESLTYAPLKALAETLGRRLWGVAMDEDGLCPEALEQACQERGGRVLYLTPTLQTPTTVTLSADRRRALIAVARRHRLTVIEDDVFGQLPPTPPPPLATLGPEITVTLTSVSKTLAPGLRVGFVRAPADLAARIAAAVTLSCWMPPPLMVEIVGQWLADGTADRLTTTQRAIARRRQGMARSRLGVAALGADPSGLHLWLPLPEPWTATAFRREAAERGVLVTEAEAFAVTPGSAPEAVRLCLSHEAEEERVTAGLDRLRDLLARGPGPAPLVL